MPCGVHCFNIFVYIFSDNLRAQFPGRETTYYNEGISRCLKGMASKFKHKSSQTSGEPDLTEHLAASVAASSTPSEDASAPAVAALSATSEVDSGSAAITTPSASEEEAAAAVLAASSAIPLRFSTDRSANHDDSSSNEEEIDPGTSANFSSTF